MVAAADLQFFFQIEKTYTRKMPACSAYIGPGSGLLNRPVGGDPNGRENSSIWIKN
jgi:hypothetical protein